MHQPLDHNLTWSIDGNSTEFRLDGILIARILSRKLEYDYFPIEVIARIRGMLDFTLAEARAVWDSRKPEQC